MILLALASVVVAAGTGVVTARLSPDRADYREAIVVAHVPMALNPLLSGGDSAARDVAPLLYPALLRLDENAVPRTDLAASWGVTGDGLTYRFALPAGRTWSNGVPLTPADVVATIALVQAAGYPDAAFAANWQGVVASVTGGAVTLSLPVARASFPVTVSDLPILPAAELAHRTVAQLVARAATPMPTSGPYIVDSAGASDGSMLDLTANARSPVRPRLTTLELHLVTGFPQALQLFQQGEVDAVMSTTPAERSQLAHLDHTHLHDTLTFEYADLLFDEHTPGLDDVAVRSAIAGAINRTALVNGPLANAARPEVGALPAGILWAQLPAAATADPTPALAEQALDAAGWIAGPDGIRRKGGIALEYTLRAPATAPLPAVSDAIAAQLRPLGIALRVVQMPTGQFTQQVIGDSAFQLALVDWRTDGDPDITSFWRSNATPPQGFNVSHGPADPFLDQALDALSTLSDLQLRRAAAARVNSRLTDDVPAVFLYAPTVTLATNDRFADVPVPATGGAAARFGEMAGWPAPGS